jgi:nucleoside-diphosphate-sugar epimerase
VGLFGNRNAINEAFHITSNEWLTWNQIYGILAAELQVKPTIVHIPSEVIVKYNKEIGDGLLGDKAHSMLFDNSKIKSFVPDFNPQVKFRDGAKEMIKWYKENTINEEADKDINEFMDKIIDDYAVKSC